MGQWYYTIDGKQNGPVSETEFIKLFETAELGPDTLVWSEGLDDWTPALKIEGLIPTDFNPPPAPLPPSPNDVWPESNLNARPPSGSQVRHRARPWVRPWVRYWARTMDFIIFCFLAGIILGFVYPSALEIPDGLFGILLLFAYNFVEPAMFAAWGTTPGKALLRVRVRNADGGRLSYSEALTRVFKVWFRGQGLGIPIVALFTQINAYNRLTKKGKTTWDREGNISVRHQLIEAWRVVVVVLFFTGFVFLMVLGRVGI